LKIDLFCHIYPKRYVDHVLELPKASIVKNFLSYSPALLDLEKRMKIMKKYDIDMQVLTLAYPCVEGLNQKTEVKLAKAANDGIRDIVEDNPERFIGIATLPLTNIIDTLDEMKRAIEDLGMKGIQIHSNIRGKPIDSKEFDPIFQLASKYDIPILIHPINVKYYSWIDENNLSMMLGWPFDTTLAMVRLTFSGVFDRYPNIKFVTHHLGGMVPYYFGRINGFYEDMLPENRPKLMRSPGDYLKKFYLDTVVHGWAPALQFAYTFSGHERIVFATDYPFGTNEGEKSVDTTVRSLNEMQIPDEHKKSIFSENAVRLLKI